MTVHSAGSLIKHAEIKRSVRQGTTPIGEMLESLASNDAEFDAALRKAIESHGRSFIEVHGTARQNRFEGTLRVADFETQISLPVRTERTDGIMTASVTATVDPSKCETLMPGVTKAQLNVTFRVPSSGNAVLAGGSTRFVN